MTAPDSRNSTAAADLHGEITSAVDELRRLVPQPDPQFYPAGEDDGHQAKWALDGILENAAEWQQRTVKLADAVEELHNVLHRGSLLMCPLSPCSGLHTELVEARRAAR